MLGRRAAHDPGGQRRQVLQPGRLSRPLALLAALTLAACSATTTPAPTGSDPGGATRSPGGGPSASPDPGGGHGGTGGGPGSEPGGGGSNGGGGGSSPNPQDHGPLGLYDERFLSAAIPNARVEVDTTGPELTQRARDGLAAALREHGGKSVTFTPTGSAPRQDSYTDDDLRRIARQTRQSFSTERRAVVHVLVLEGSYRDRGALGVAFDASSFAIFPDRIASGLLSSVSYAAFEEAVVVHELGHLFGLVNITGQGGFHEDPAHPGHSRNQGSVMFWAVDDVSVSNIFRGGPPNTFDADDRREMAAIRE